MATSDGGGTGLMGSPGEMLTLIREGRARTRSELVELTGLARSTVSQRIDTLLDVQLIYEAGEARSNGGRPPMVLAFNHGAGVALVADLGATHCRLAVTDLAGSALQELAADLAIADGPDVVVPWLVARFEEMLAAAGCAPSDVRGIGVGLPGPVEFSAGRAVNPPIMPGWDGVDVPARLQEHFPVPVLVDNDVNIMALGEHWTTWRGRAHDLLFVKVGTGIGCGIVAGGRIHRGHLGAAGDIGHIRVSSDVDALCRCGNIGCVEAVAGGAALAGQLGEQGVAATDARLGAARARGGDAVATAVVREAGRRLGEVLAGAVNLFNPGVIVVGGDLAHAADQLLAGVREQVYERSTPLATQHLTIERSRLGDRAGVTGAGVMIIERILSPAAVDAAIAGRVGV